MSWRTSETFTVFPAIDLRGGRCVRLYQGDYDQETVYGEDPVAQAQAFVSEGADVLHVVDLDAARTGEPTNRAVIEAICSSVAVPVQVGGGVRTIDAAVALFDIGVGRVVIGTAALEQPELVEAVAGRGFAVAVGLDARGDEVATHGWTERTGITTQQMASRFADAGVDALVVTEIGRDGTMAGPDLDGLGSLLGGTDINVVASGGVGDASHVRDLAALDRNGRALAGVITGRALYEGALSLGEALAAASAGRSDEQGEARR